MQCTEARSLLTVAGTPGCRPTLQPSSLLVVKSNGLETHKACVQCHVLQSLLARVRLQLNTVFLVLLRPALRRLTTSQRARHPESMLRMLSPVTRKEECNTVAMSALSRSMARAIGALLATPVNDSAHAPL